MFIDFVQVRSAADMFEAMKARFLDNDIIIKAAAVADYTPASYNEEKTKKKMYQSMGIMTGIFLVIMLV